VWLCACDRLSMTNVKMTIMSCEVHMSHVACIEPWEVGVEATKLL
jgi:hypothetical protein